MPTLLTPVNDQQLNGGLARVASTVTGGVTQLREQAAYWLAVLSEDNLEAGLIVRLGGPDVTPLTQAEMDQYRVYWQQVDLIAGLWDEAQGFDPAVVICRPWLAVP